MILGLISVCGSWTALNSLNNITPKFKVLSRLSLYCNHLCQTLSNTAQRSKNMLWASSDELQSKLIYIQVLDKKRDWDKT